MKEEAQRQRPNGENRSSSKKKIVVSILIIIIAVASPFLVFFGLQVALNTSSPMTVVISGSMEPTYHKGDLLFLYGEKPENIQEGDVIVFHATHWPIPPDEPIVHRVIEKQYDNESEQWEFKTKGDANPTADYGWVPGENIIGKVVGWVPFIGWVKIILTQGNLLIPLIFFIILLLIISILWDVIQKEEEGENPEQKEPPREIPS